MDRTSDGQPSADAAGLGGGICMVMMDVHLSSLLNLPQSGMRLLQHDCKYKVDRNIVATTLRKSFSTMEIGECRVATCHGGP
jgi:hypothetical protein